MATKRIPDVAWEISSQRDHFAARRESAAQSGGEHPQDLTVGELLDLADLDRIRDLKLGYGTSAGSIALREAIADGCGVPAEQIITTQGTALGLFLLAFEVCRPGDEAVLATPCFPPSRRLPSTRPASTSARSFLVVFENGYRLDLDRIDASLSSTTKLVSYRFGHKIQLAFRRLPADIEEAPSS